jgi:hypothetical protein
MNNEAIRFITISYLKGLLTAFQLGDLRQITSPSISYL